MISQYVVYDADGRILRYGSCPEDMVEHQAHNPGELVMLGTCDDELHYVKGDEIVERPESTATLAGATLTGLPVPCTIKIDGTAYPCDEPTAELSFPYAGTFAVRVEAWPHLDAVFEVTA